MTKQYWLSWSGFDTYQQCPKKYKLTRVDKATPPEPDSRHNAIVGSVVQRVYEDFYNEELWRSGRETSKILLERTPKYFYDYLDKEYVDFSHVTCRFTQIEALDRCLEMVPKVLEGIKREGLLGPYARSEVQLKAHLQGSYHLFGIADFIIRKKNGEILLVDGKASRHREKYVDKKQLTFYALLFYLLHRRLPDKIGFFFYHFADDPEKAFDWYVPTREEVAALRQELVDTFGKVQRLWFRATPSSNACQFCPWQAVCPERQKQKAVRREKRRWNRAQRGEETLPSLSESSSGTAMVGFGGVFKPEE